MSMNGPVCDSYIPLQKLQKIYAAQQQSEWCWAASISMIFAFSGHPVRQARIVKEAYGSVMNMPGNYPALFGSLDRNWTDENGDDFSVTLNHLFAPDVGVGNLSNADLAQALEDENPVLYCTSQHAMVLTSMKYIGSNVIDAWVMDPWPGNGLRHLSPLEMRPMLFGGQLRMAATIDVS